MEANYISSLIPLSLKETKERRGGLYWRYRLPPRLRWVFDDCSNLRGMTLKLKKTARRKRRRALAEPRSYDWIQIKRRPNGVPAF
jgi:hypothetical protein